MKTKTLVQFVASVAFVATTVLEAVAKEETTLPVVSVSMSTNGNYNFKSFQVDADREGEYFAEFWLQSAKYANNKYSQYIVYVNDKYVGYISSNDGNWHSARICGNEKVKLNKGANSITIAALAPEFPEAEAVNVALNSEDASFSSTSYDSYLNDATVSKSRKAIMNNMATDSDGLSESGVECFENVPLTYTFYKNFSFTKGQDIFVTTSSKDMHKIDFVYYGSEPIFEESHPINGYSSNGARMISIDSISTGPAIGQPTIKFRYNYTPATAAEMQGLSWTFPSQLTLNGTAQVATGRIKIPKSGQYLLRVRHGVNQQVSVADINVNGNYFYENSPISLSQVNCAIPSDGNEYAVMTRCKSSGYDNPYLFVHGGDADKVVGFNDDASLNMQKQFGLSKFDSFLSQSFFMETSGVSVNNYSSYKPVSKCDIIVGQVEEVELSSAKAMRRASVTSNISDTQFDARLQIVCTGKVGGVLNIASNEEIQKVSAYSLTGNVISTMECNSNTISIPLSEINIKETGVYVVSVKSSNGIVSKKIIVE